MRQQQYDQFKKLLVYLYGVQLIRLWVDDASACWARLTFLQPFAYALVVKAVTTWRIQHRTIPELCQTHRTFIL